MRRCLAILLLVFMPFQFSWAALATYCEHETGRQARHVGHHEHEHEREQQQRSDAAGEDSKPKSSSAFDAAECSCHGQSMAALPTFLGPPMRIVASRVTDEPARNAVAPAPDRPERPQWMGHA